MYQYLNSPVQPVTFGDAMQISLNNYYDILKANAGSLGANELLQLKLVADIIDITDKKNKEGGYEWFSFYNLIRRSDLEIEPDPVSGTALAGIAKVSELYGKFLNKLSRYVLIKELSPEDQKKKSDLDVEIEALTTQIGTYANLDYATWKQYCELHGYNPADMARYNQWAEVFGHAKRIQELIDIQTEKNFEVIQIIDRKYPNADDQEIVTALVNYRSSSMRLCYPTLPDYLYLPTEISLQYLLSLLPVSTGQFDARYSMGFDLDPIKIKTTQAGAINGKFNHTTTDSSTITTDWSASGSIGYFFINVSASASDHKTISEEFRTATEMKLNAKAAFRVNINYGPWFNANLFRSKYIKANPAVFMEFFGAKGSLLLYPKALILVRGFSAEFSNSQNWTYDYEHNFSASVGGGFSVFGINFGGSQFYSQNTKEHKIDQAGTSLKISDDENTLRFVGYAVEKNEFLPEKMLEDFLVSKK
jgi:hypothetical protein